MDSVSTGVIIILVLLLIYHIGKNEYKKREYQRADPVLYQQRVLRMQTKYGNYCKATVLLHECLDDIDMFLGKTYAKLNVEIHHENDNVAGNTAHSIFLAIKKNYNRDAINENDPAVSNETSYTINKGQKIMVCMRNKMKPLVLEDKNTLMFVLLHELAHIGNIGWGHESDFWQVFKVILGEAIECGIYDPVNYEVSPVQYCGLYVNYNPWFDDSIIIMAAPKGVYIEPSYVNALYSDDTYGYAESRMIWIRYASGARYAYPGRYKWDDADGNKYVWEALNPKDEYSTWFSMLNKGDAIHNPFSIKEALNAYKNLFGPDNGNINPNNGITSIRMTSNTRIKIVSNSTKDYVRTETRQADNTFEFVNIYECDASGNIWFLPGFRELPPNNITAKMIADGMTKDSRTDCRRSCCDGYDGGKAGIGNDGKVKFTSVSGREDDNRMGVPYRTGETQDIITRNHYFVQTDGDDNDAYKDGKGECRLDESDNIDTEASWPNLGDPNLGAEGVIHRIYIQALPNIAALQSASCFARQGSLLELACKIYLFDKNPVDVLNRDIDRLGRDEHIPGLTRNPLTEECYNNGLKLCSAPSSHSYYARDMGEGPYGHSIYTNPYGKNTRDEYYGTLIPGNNSQLTGNLLNNYDWSSKHANIPFANNNAYMRSSLCQNWANKYRLYEKPSSSNSITKIDNMMEKYCKADRTASVNAGVPSDPFCACINFRNESIEKSGGYSIDPTCSSASCINTPIDGRRAYWPTNALKGKCVDSEKCGVTCPQLTLCINHIDIDNVAGDVILSEISQASNCAGNSEVKDNFISDRKPRISAKRDQNAGSRDESFVASALDWTSGGEAELIPPPSCSVERPTNVDIIAPVYTVQADPVETPSVNPHEVDREIENSWWYNILILLIIITIVSAIYRWMKNNMVEGERKVTFF